MVVWKVVLRLLLLGGVSGQWLFKCVSGLDSVFIEIDSPFKNSLCQIRAKKLTSGS